MDIFKKYLILTIMIAFMGCGDNVKVIIEGPTNLLMNPYPLNYPTTNPKENAVISQLKKGDEGEVLDYKYGKDFKAYKVELKNGKIGYLISGDNFRISK